MEKQLQTFAMVFPDRLEIWKDPNGSPWENQLFEMLNGRWTSDPRMLTVGRKSVIGKTYLCRTGFRITVLWIDGVTYNERAYKRLLRRIRHHTGVIRP